MSFTTEFHTLVTTLEDEGHGLADKARNLFSKYEKEAEAIIDGLKPLLAQGHAELLAGVKELLAEAATDKDKLAALVAAEVAKLLAETKPAA